MGPDPLAEAKSRALAVLGQVASKEGCHIGRGKWHLG